jgi:hypothetical protein
LPDTIIETPRPEMLAGAVINAPAAVDLAADILYSRTIQTTQLLLIQVMRHGKSGNYMHRPFER